MLLSIVVPAFNEEGYLGETLASLDRAKAFLQRERSIQTEIIVVDNDSDDATADVEHAQGVTVAREALHNVAQVRNAGAKLSNGETIVFVDADTVVPENLLSRIVDVMSDDTCFGGAVDTDYQPKKLTAQAYLGFWRIIGKLTGMAQGRFLYAQGLRRNAVHWRGRRSLLALEEICKAAKWQRRFHRGHKSRPFDSPF